MTFFEYIDYLFLGVEDVNFPGTYLLQKFFAIYSTADVFLSLP